MSNTDIPSDAPVRHILSLSGGKDSTALAIYMRDKVPGMEYVFCDTAKELTETYDYLDRLEVYLGQPIVRLKTDRQRLHVTSICMAGYCRMLAFAGVQKLKIRAFERYVGDETVINYIGISADENRTGNISSKPNLTSRYPFKEDGIYKQDVARIFEESGLGFPDYYKWRSRSGCYFCFFQQRVSGWAFWKTILNCLKKPKTYEKEDAETGRSYTWNQRKSLIQLAKPERMAQIRRSARSGWLRSLQVG